MFRYFSHVTLDTGHDYRSPDSAVTQGVIDLVLPHLNEALARPRPVPNVPGYFLRATADGTSLVATVLRQEVPVLTFGVALEAGAAANLWHMLHDEHLRPAGFPPLETSPTDVPMVPWCGVVFLNYREVIRATEWLGDYERCITWAWIHIVARELPGDAVAEPDEEVERPAPRPRFVGGARSGPVRIENDGQVLTRTNYWNTKLAAKGMLYLSWNAGAARLLVPARMIHVLPNMRTARCVIVTRGFWTGHGLEALELLFDDGSDAPYVTLIAIEQTDQVLPEGEIGRRFAFHVYTRAGLKFETEGRYRVSPTLPCLARWTDAARRSR